LTGITDIWAAKMIMALFFWIAENNTYNIDPRNGDKDRRVGDGVHGDGDVRYKSKKRADDDDSDIERSRSRSGLWLPDLSWPNIPKRRKMYQIMISQHYQIYQLAVKYSKW
jgi:hypothetical protein